MAYPFLVVASASPLWWTGSMVAAALVLVVAVTIAMIGSMRATAARSAQSARTSGRQEARRPRQLPGPSLVRSNREFELYS